MNDGTLFSTYLNECKRNYLTDCMKRIPKNWFITQTERFKTGDFINLKFPDGDVIEIKSIIEDKLRYYTANYLKY